MLWGRLVKIIYLVTHLRGYFRLREILRRDRRFCAEPHCKWLNLKYVRIYAMRFMSTNDKYSCMAFHYNFVSGRLSSEVSKELLSGRTHFWDTTVSGNALCIDLRRSTLTAIEGELVLNFVYNGRIIFMLTFSVVPGTCFGESAWPVIYVGGLQGRPSCREDIRAASKLNREIDPATMLLMALKSIGIAWNIETIVAVAATYQVSANAVESTIDSSVIYDQFWVKSGGTAFHDRAYKIRTRSQRGAHDPVFGSHKSRTRRKRMAKDALGGDLAMCASRAFAVTDFSAAAYPEPAARGARTAPRGALVPASRSGGALAQVVVFDFDRPLAEFAGAAPIYLPSANDPSRR
jgi:uncharacterized protein VirK/YbjX